MTRILFKFIIYPSCERVLKNGRVKTKIVRKSSFGDMIFLTSLDYIWLISICFLYCAKKGIVVEILKVSYPLEKSLPVENAGTNFSISPYCTLLFSRKENKYFEVALSAVLCNGAVGCTMNAWDISIEIRPIPHWTFTCFSKTAIKTLKQGVKFVQTSQSVLQQSTFVLLVSFLLTLNTFHTLL